MNTGSYVAFLLLGVILIVADGQLLYHSGREYLSAAYGNGRDAAPIGRLISVLFHLVMLGVLGVLSTVDVPVNGSLPAVVTRIGILLLILGAGHGLTIWTLAGIRNRQQDRRLATDLTEQYEERAHHGTAVERAHDRPVWTPSGGSEQPYSTAGAQSDINNTANDE
ncbi:MAG TPA: hypothetical protein VG317_15725 [Pseudonocardiaceae bacterium]|jgi:hypothetical protein|nr:hypothetical protein [Pseudonocardiaceae bacterium]